jgi:hypothetical protein
MAADSTSTTAKTGDKASIHSMRARPLKLLDPFFVIFNPRPKLPNG